MAASSVGKGLGKESLRLKWRSSFIEVVPPEEEKEPRSLSEPEDIGTQDRRDRFFGLERESVDNLSTRLRVFWEANQEPSDDDDDDKSRSINGASVCDSAPTVVADCWHVRKSRHTGPRRMARNFNVNAEIIAKSSIEGHRHPGTHMSQNSDIKSRILTNSRGLDFHQRLTTALQTIDDIPDHVADVLRQEAVSMADDVQGEVAAFHSALHGQEIGDRSGDGKIADTLATIPDIILTSFETSFQEAKSTVRRCVEEMTQRLEGSDMNKDTIIEQFWNIPDEVQKITADATDVAVTQCQAKVMELIDGALKTLPPSERMNSGKVVAAVAQIVAKVHKAARAVAVNTVEDAVATVQQEHGGKVHNRVIADALLRAKAKLGDLPAEGQLHKSTEEFGRLPREKRGRKAREKKRGGLPGIVNGGERGRDGNAGTDADGEPELSPHARELFASTKEARKTLSDSPLFYTQPGHERSVVDGLSNCDSSPAVFEGFQSRHFDNWASRADNLDRPDGTAPGGSAIFVNHPAVSHEQRLSAALAAMDAIPEQLASVLEGNAKDLAAELEEELTMIRHLNHPGETAADREALDSLVSIPDMILTSFEKKFLHVKQAVRQRVNHMMQTMTDSHLGSAQLMDELWAIPEEVEQIAGEAVEEAMQESQEQASRQLEHALQALPQTTTLNPRALSNVKMQIMDRVPDVYPRTLLAARDTAALNVQHVLAAVDLSEDCDQQVLTDAINYSNTRARQDGEEETANAQAGMEMTDESRNFPVDPSSASGAPSQEGFPGGEGADLQDSACLNPGSMGHPELCPRPCLYFPLGECRNGLNCDFCHRPHPKRPAHLDKRHREILKAMPFATCLAIMHPILQEKVQSLDLPDSVMEGLSKLGESVAQNTSATARQSKEARLLHSALSAMSLRSLLTTLHRTMLPRGSLERSAIDNILQHLRLSSHTRESLS
mmetsp:Transcript_59476/g.128629  ORF Transcript_59476/g.128629 Transcript_59476/m.128629 type:complete len:950 (+) Transcript_59476:49-2898(+)